MSGLDDEYDGRVRGRNVDTHDPEGRQTVRELGFETHGLVIRGRDGLVLWSQADHQVNMDDVGRALRELLTKEAERRK